MKTLFSSLLFALASVVAFAQPFDCDSLTIESITHDPFVDTVLALHVTNNSPNSNFSYPGFVLTDGAGDTVASEMVNFFGIPTENTHPLQLHPGMQTATTLSGTLDLWVNFYDTLACSYALPVNLCPISTCGELYLRIENFGGALAITSRPYTISNQNGAVVHTGTLTLTQTVQAAADTVCLPPGDYTVQMDADSMSMGAVYFSLVPAYPSSSFYSTPVQPNGINHDFSWWKNCEGPSAIAAPAASQQATAYFSGSELVLNSNSDSPLLHCTVFNVQGQQVLQQRMSSPSGRLAANQLPMGLYLVQLETATGTAVVKVLRVQ